MSIQYTQVPSDTFEKLQLNAGMLLDEFAPATGVIGNILGATRGGINFASNPSYVDIGENIDNVPANTMQLKRLQAYDPTMSGTFLTVDADMVADLLGAADVDGTDTTKVVPRSYLLETDFDEVWWVGDYSDKNTGTTAGFIAIHLLNALNTTGFNIQSTKDDNGTMSFEYHAHYDLEHMDQVPFEIYVKAGASSGDIPTIRLNNNYVTVADEDTVTLTATTKPAGQAVTWSSASTTIATVSGGVVTGKQVGNTVITASITVTGVTYSDTCTVVVTA